ncbi:hypothetical protein MBLNU230_g4561t1 [Neophaeotheca triangularis]
MLAYSCTSWGGSGRDKYAENWYQNLVWFSGTCHFRSCGEALKIHVLQNPDKKSKAKAEEEPEGDEESDGDGEEQDESTAVSSTKGKKGAHGSRKDIRATSKFNLTVAVEDSRVGSRAEREHISTNRPDTYWCLYNLLATTRWHSGFGPFFLYFAHLEHSVCKAMRGKDTFIASTLPENES